MNDRELLESAAKAAGYNFEWDDSDERFAIEPFQGADRFVWNRWNPLYNDGDAFRLMVTLGMEIKCYSNVIVVTTPDGVDEEELTGEETCKPDELAATRRAIVRAAAAMVEEKEE